MLGGLPVLLRAYVVWGWASYLVTRRLSGLRTEAAGPGQALRLYARYHRAFPASLHGGSMTSAYSRSGRRCLGMESDRAGLLPRAPVLSEDLACGPTLGPDVRAAAVRDIRVFSTVSGSAAGGPNPARPCGTYSHAIAPPVVKSRRPIHVSPFALCCPP